MPPDRPITATCIHRDHIGGRKYFPDFYVHQAKLPWLQGEFPLSIETVPETAPPNFFAACGRGTETILTGGAEIK